MPGAVFGQWAEAHERGFVVEVLPVLFGHGHGVGVCFWHVAVAVHHVGHLADRSPDGEGGERPRRADRGCGEGCAGVVGDQALYRSAPAEEPEELGQFEARERHGDGRLLLVGSARSRWQVGQGCELPVAPQELQAHVPAAGQLLAQLVVPEEAFQRGFVVPFGEHRDPAELQAREGDGRRPELHHRQALRVAQPRCRPRGRRADERARRRRRGQLREVEGVDQADAAVAHSPSLSAQVTRSLVWGLPGRGRLEGAVVERGLLVGEWPRALTARTRPGR